MFRGVFRVLRRPHGPRAVVPVELVTGSVAQEKQKRLEMWSIRLHPSSSEVVHRRCEAFCTPLTPRFQLESRAPLLTRPFQFRAGNGFCSPLELMQQLVARRQSWDHMQKERSA